MPSILVINPNSSQKVTENLKNTIAPPPNVELAFYTAPDTSPKEIDGAETLAISEKAVLDDILPKKLLDHHDGFLVGCYSDHPLIESLASHTHKPVLGIMHATLLYAYANPAFNRLIIITSTEGWVKLLDDAITRFAGVGSFPYLKFQKTAALDVLVLNLSDPQEFLQICTRVRWILDLNASSPIDCVLLGCAGMAGLDDKLHEEFPNVRFVDSVKAGVQFLAALMAI